MKSIAAFWEIPSLPGYEISRKGEVRRIGEKYPKKTWVGYHGYTVFILYTGKKHRTYTVHRIVAEMFLPNPNGFRYVGFIDGNPANPALENLFWKPGGKSKTEEQKQILNVEKVGNWLI